MILICFVYVLQAGTDPDEKAPALEKIPTNQFIDSLVHDDDDDNDEGVVGERASHTVSLTLADKRSSRPVTWATAEPLPEEADELETVIDIGGEFNL